MKKLENAIVLRIARLGRNDPPAHSHRKYRAIFRDSGGWHRFQTYDDPVEAFRQVRRYSSDHKVVSQLPSYQWVELTPLDAWKIDPKPYAVSLERLEGPHWERVAMVKRPASLVGRRVDPGLYRVMLDAETDGIPAGWMSAEGAGGWFLLGGSLVGPEDGELL